MTVTIYPSRTRGTVAAPPSKSMAHRLLIAAGLAEGESVVTGIAPSEDVLATVDCLGALGATLTYENDTVKVTGIGGKVKAKEPHLPCRECGSTLRFFVPIAMLSEEKTTFTGSEKLLSRPMAVYEELAKEKGLSYHGTPHGITVKGKLPSGEYRLPGNVSSQFISGLLFALPTLSGESRIVITPPVESRSYIDLTLSALATFGITARWENEYTLYIKGGETYKSRRVAVEGDYSNAAFFSALATLGDPVTVTGLDPDSLQGDRIYLDCFEKLKAGKPTLSLADCPDLGPVLFALASALNGATFTDTRRLKIKESDRAEAMKTELAKLGVNVTVEENTVTVEKADLHAPKVPLSGHNDHRIVMALSLLLTRTGGKIEGAEAVRKSMPDFFARLEALGVTLETE